MLAGAMCIMRRNMPNPGLKNPSEHMVSSTLSPATAASNNQNICVLWKLLFLTQFGLVMGLVKRSASPGCPEVKYTHSVQRSSCMSGGRMTNGETRYKAKPLP